MTRIPRRTILRGAAGAAIALPWLEAMSPRQARAATAPRKRFVVMFSPNGTIPTAWTPTRGPSGAETDFTLSPILSPLEPHQADIVVVQGLNQQGGGGDGHQNGIGGMLTGSPLNPGPFAGVGAPPAGWATGPSVDQRIADGLAAPTKLRSLELGVAGRLRRQLGAHVLPRRQPAPAARPTIRRRSTRACSPTCTPIRRCWRGSARRRKSILDAVGGEYTRLSARLGAADQQRLDAHLTAVREIETRLTSDLVVGNAACHDPVVAPVAAQANDSFPTVGGLQLDLMTMAFACDLTRVASLQWARSVSQMRFSWLGITEGHHDLSHRSDSDVGAVDKLTRINTWYATQLAGLIQRLKSTPDGAGGTLFDGTLILWCNELAKGNTHSRISAPYVLAGSAGGALRTGRYLNYDGQSLPHNNLLVSLLNAMGLPDTRFGKTDWCTGPLTGLL